MLCCTGHYGERRQNRRRRGILAVRWGTGRGELEIMKLREDIVEGDIMVGHGKGERRV